MKIDELSVLRPGPDVRWRKYLKSVVIEPGIALNETAAAVFTQMDGTRTIGEISKSIAIEYEIAYADCLRDVVELVQQMADNSLLVEAPANGK